MNIYAQITIEDWFDYPKPRDRGWTAIYTLIFDGEYYWRQCNWGPESFNKYVSAILSKSYTDVINCKKPGTHFLFKESDNDREMVVFDSIKFLESDIENLCKT